jgi:hypothetical protein
VSEGYRAKTRDGEEVVGAMGIPVYWRSGFAPKREGECSPGCDAGHGLPFVNLVLPPLRWQAATFATRRARWGTRAKQGGASKEGEESQTSER